MLRVILEYNKFRVITAISGKDAINILSEMESPPDLIISDILMPDVDGYQLFQAISKTPQLNLIPFIFLTAKSSPEDIRFGKMLGVDDYVTKPFKEEDLLAIIEGKLARKKKGIQIKEKLDILVSAMDIRILPSISEEEKHNVIMVYVKWDDRTGPRLKKHYPMNIKIPISIKDIGTQLFQAAVTIYGQEKFTKAEDVLLYIDNIKRRGYILFDTFPDPEVRGGETQFMLGLIAPNINYLESRQVKKVFEDISIYIKKREDWSIKQYWERCIEILSSPPV